MDLRGITTENISEAVDVYGPSPGGIALLRGENIASQEAIESGLYVIWFPQSLDLIPEQANKERYQTNNEQCCRVGRASLCLCGHSLNEHKEVKSKSKGFIQPPKCKKNNCRCFGYSYMPSRPEGCGQWWLPRRRDFDLNAWRKVILFS